MTTPLETIIAAAESAIGTPYRWGGSSLASGVDCSGLVQQAFLAAGIRLPRVSASQMRVGQPVPSLDQAQPGDLLGYQTGDRNGAGVEHIAIYVGNGLMIEAYKTGEPVRVTQVRPGAEVRRVIGNIDAGTPGQVQLGSHADRAITTSVLTGEPPAGIDVAPAITVTEAPQGGLGDDLPPDASVEDTLAYIQQHFPSVAPFMANDEIKMLLVAAARDDWSSAKLDQALQNTEYYKTHGATSRQFDLLLGTDEAEAVRVIGDAKAIVGDLFSRNGVDLDDAELGELAKQAIRAGHITLQGQVMNADGLNGMLAARLNEQGVTGGDTAFNAEALGQIARSYMIPISRATLDEWAVRILDGSRSEQGFIEYVRNLARGQHDKDQDILAAIDRGQTLEEYFDPYRERLAQLFEMTPDQIDLQSTRYKDVTSFWDGSQRRAMTMGELDRWARRQQEAQNTSWWREEKGDKVSRLREWAGVQS